MPRFAELALGMIAALRMAMPKPSTLVTTLSPQDDDPACQLVTRIHGLTLELAGHHLRYSHRTRLERLLLKLDDILVPLTSGVLASRAIELCDAAIGTCRRLSSLLGFLMTANVLTPEQHARLSVLSRRLERSLLDRREKALSANGITFSRAAGSERVRRTRVRRDARVPARGQVPATPGPAEIHGDAAAAPAERALI